MRIVRTKSICGGQPRVAGTRLAVGHVLRALAAVDGDISQVTKSYPAISKEAVLVCLSYAAKRVEA